MKSLIIPSIALLVSILCLLYTRRKAIEAEASAKLWEARLESMRTEKFASMNPPSLQIVQPNPIIDQSAVERNANAGRSLLVQCLNCLAAYCVVPEYNTLAPCPYCRSTLEKRTVSVSVEPKEGDKQ